MRNLTTLRASVLSLLLAALAGGADRAPAVGDLIWPAAGFVVSSEPGAPAHGKLGSSPALTLEVRSGAPGGPWYRLLASDGTVAWAPRVSGKTVRASARLSEMMNRSPDDPEFGAEAEPVVVSLERPAAITGASAISRVPSLSNLMLPERQNPLLTPWLRLRDGARTGWQAPSELKLLWTIPPIGDPWEGLVRRPFLGPSLPSLEALKPQDGKPVWRFSDLTAPPELSALSEKKWGDAELLLRLPTKSSRGIARLAVFPGAGSRLLALESPDGRAVHAVMESYAPLITGFATADLDRDGYEELLLELVQVFGDGSYSTLWVIDGRSVERGLKIAAAPLGGSSGEPGGSSVDGWWWVDGPTLWIVRRESRVEAVSASYRDGKLAARTGEIYAAVLMRNPSLIEARRRAWAESSRRKQAIHVFPDGKRGTGLWAVGKLFASRTAALGLKGGTVSQIAIGSLAGKPSH